MSDSRKAIAAARALAQATFAPERVTELVISNEGPRPAGGRSWIVRAWSSGHGLMLLRVVLAPGGILTTETLSVSVEPDSLS